MRIYSKVTIDIGSGEVLDAIFTEYHGPVSQAKGSSSTKGGGVTSQTTTQTNPTVDRLAAMGEGFIGPALQGRSFEPVTGVRSMVESQLMPLIPLMQKQLMGEYGQGGVFNLPGQISGHQSLSPLARDLAIRQAGDVFDPTRTTGMFEQSIQRMLPQIRGGLAARGIAPGGVAQGIESTAIGNTALDFAMREDAARRDAINNLMGVSQGDLAERLQRTGGELSAITGGQSAIARGFGLPLDVLNQAISTELSPFQALMQLTGAAAGGTNVSTSAGTSNQSQRSSQPSGIFGK